MTAVASAPVETEPQGVWHSEWLVVFEPIADRVADPGAPRYWHNGSASLRVSGWEGSDLRSAEDGTWVVLFSGVLTNAAALLKGATQDDAARVVLRLLGVHGRDALKYLRGPFAVIAWNRQAQSLLVGRDQIGLEPIYYARGGRRWVLSASPDVLVRQPGVSGDADAVALSEWVCGWFPAVEDTAYREVKRVPPASAITFEESGATVSRYWDPFSDVGNLQWLSEQDLDQFEPLLDQAVTRAMQGLPSSVFLSGGVDSISVAVTAADLARRTRTSDPLALSLGFPEGESNEETIQRGVASQLGLEQILVPLEKASGHRGLLDEALRSSADWPQPMWNVWSPAYMTLARHAADAGRRVVLTGRGGDEWLTISPYLLADQIGRGDWRGAWRQIQMRRRSNNLAGMRQMSWLLWTTAGRPLASAALDAVAPGPWHRQRRRRLLSERPAWVAPDPAVRRAMDERIERWMDPARPAGGFYLREAQTAVRHTAVTQDMEETHEFGRRNGLRVMHPYWDVDLVDMLYRVPPRLLMADGRAKSLVRSRLAKRLPGLGLERRGKVNAGYVFHNIMEREAPALWTRMNGLEALGRIGVVDSAGIESARQARQWRLTRGRLWTLMTFESWTRRRV